MSTTLSKLVLQGEESVLFDCSALLNQTCVRSDAGYYSSCSSLSPDSSVDSCFFSSPSLPWGAGQEAAECFVIRSHGKQDKKQSLVGQTKKRSRSKYPGKKRQSASEREKLRMRDLTKALNHLRTYLPPSVAPAGQSLTKIETLRLTIRYISQLSAQLGLSDEIRSQGREAQCQGIPVDLSQSTTGPQENENLFQLLTNDAEATNDASLWNCISEPSDQFSVPPLSCQNTSGSKISHLLSGEYWVPQQQYILSGNC